MFYELVAQLDHFHLNLWTIAVVGVIVAGTTMFLGKFLVGRRPSCVSSVPERSASALCDPFVFGGSLEKRTALRRAGKSVKVLISTTAAREQPLEGWILDRSTGGLCVSVPQSFPQGTVLTIRAANAPPGTPSVRARVRHQRSHDDRWAVGCQYQEAYPWNVLLLFG